MKSSKHRKTDPSAVAAERATHRGESRERHDLFRFIPGLY